MFEPLISNARRDASLASRPGRRHLTLPGPGLGIMIRSNY